MEKEAGKSDFSAGPSQSLALTAPPTTPNTYASAPPPLHPSLPKRPTYDFAAKADSIGLGAKPTAESLANLSTAAQALAGSNRDVVANRRAIRLANMSAAEVLKAELAGLSPVKPSSNSPSKTAPLLPGPEPMNTLQDNERSNSTHHSTEPFHSPESESVAASVRSPPPGIAPAPLDDTADADADGEPDPDSTMESTNGIVGQTVDETAEEIQVGSKRKFEQGPGEPEATEDDVVSIEEDDDGDGVTPSLALKVNADGTVEQEDIVK